MKKTTSLFIAITFLTACDCYQHVEGRIVDQETGKPLLGATVYNKAKTSNKTLTDSTGHFELTAISGGFRCPPMHIIITKGGYQSTNTKIPAGGQKTIKLIKENFQSTAQKTIDMMQGLWKHEQDSLASVTVNHQQWTFQYKGEPPGTGQIYSIAITNKLPGVEKQKGNDQFITLTNPGDTLQYEILGISDSTLSVLYLPAGKIHVYRKIK